MTDLYSAGYLRSFHPKKPHDFRHTFITNLIGHLGGEVSIPFARDVWGHTDHRTISRYTHLWTSIQSTKEKLSMLNSVEKLEVKPL